MPADKEWSERSDNWREGLGRSIGGRSRSQRWQETFARSRSQHIKQFFQGENSIAPGKIDHGWSAAQLTLTEASQPTNGHRSQPLSGLQAIDLRRIEGQAG